MSAVDGFLVKLGEEDVGDGVEDGFGRTFEKVRQADVDASFAKSDGGVERGEAAKTYGEWRHGSAGPERAKFVLEDGDEIGGHKDRLQVADDR